MRDMMIDKEEEEDVNILFGEGVTVGVFINKKKKKKKRKKGQKKDQLVVFYLRYFKGGGVCEGVGYKRV